MPIPQPQPMRLIPRQPPGNAKRKALRYVCDVRRLRAEGHSLESIRLALLDVGISVSLSTVRREVTRPPSLWELDHEQEIASSIAEVQMTSSARHMTASPQALEASRGQSTGSLDSRVGPGRMAVANDCGTFGVLVRISRVLRSLRRTRRPP